MRAQIWILKYRNKLKNNLFYQNIAVVTGGNAAAKIIGILTAPIITRLYSPEDYGIFSILISITGIAGSLATLRYAVTVPLARDTRVADNLLKLCFLITFSLSLIFVILILVFGGYITERFSVEKITPFLWVLPVVLLGQGFYEALSNWALREKRFRLITKTKLTQGISSSFVKIGLGAISVRPLGLLIGHIAQEFAGIGSFLVQLRKTKPGFFKSFSILEIKYAAKRYKDFPLIQSWSQLLLSLGAHLPVLFIGAYYGAAVVGIYGLAQNMINMPMNLLGQSVAQVYYGEISKFGKENPNKIYGLSISLIKRLFWIALAPMALIVIFGPWIFKVVFGPEWLEAGVFARALTLIILTRFISSPVASVFNVLEKQGIQLFLNIVRVILVITVFALSLIAGVSAINTITFYSILMSLYYVFMMIIILKELKKIS